MTIPLRYNIRNLLVRKMTTFATTGSIALVVLVTILLLSLVTGLKRMLVTAGRYENLLVMHKGSTSESVSFVPRDAVQAIRYLPGIANSPNGDPLVSPELIAQPLCQSEDGIRETILVRGVTPMAFLVHTNVHFIAGRAPQPSLGEAAVGIAVSQRCQGAELEATLQFGRRTWKVVGLFTAGGSAFESEVWVDVNDLSQDTNRAFYSAVHLTVAPGADRDALIRRIAEDPRISLEAKSEVDYYNEQAEGANALYLLTLLLAVIMGIGAVLGTMNTMFAAVARRTAEVGTLRALGFSRKAVLASFISESLCLALIGYVEGALLGVGTVTLVNVLLRGVTFQLPSFSTAVVSLHLSPFILLIALSLVMLIGITGGFFPAHRAARMRVTEALRRA